MTDAEAWRELAAVWHQFGKAHARDFYRALPSEHRYRMNIACCDVMPSDDIAKRDPHRVRILAACLLAAMADADGGNHKL